MTIRESAKQTLTELSKFLDDNNHPYKFNEDKTSLVVTNTIKGYESVTYDAWEYFLISKVTEKFNSKLEYTILKEKGMCRVAVTTKANFDLQKSITSFNMHMNSIKESHILSVFLGENLNQNSKEMCLCTMLPSGTFCSSELTRAEVLFSRVYDLKAEMHQDGYYYFPALRNLYDAYTTGEDAI